jgi:hypothetical protein
MKETIKNQTLKLIEEEETDFIIPMRQVSSLCNEILTLCDDENKKADTQKMIPLLFGSEEERANKQEARFTKCDMQIAYEEILNIFESHANEKDKSSLKDKLQVFFENRLHFSPS